MEFLGTLLQGFSDQHWFQMVAEITLFMSAISASMPASWKKDKQGKPRILYEWLYEVVEFLAINVFHAKSKD